MSILMLVTTLQYESLYPTFVQKFDNFSLHNNQKHSRYFYTKKSHCSYPVPYAKVKLGSWYFCSYKRSDVVWQLLGSWRALVILILLSLLGKRRNERKERRHILLFLRTRCVHVSPKLWRQSNTITERTTKAFTNLNFPAKNWDHTLLFFTGSDSFFVARNSNLW